MWIDLWINDISGHFKMEQPIDEYIHSKWIYGFLII